MKTLITSIAAFLLFAGNVNAAETTSTTAAAENKASSMGTISSKSLSAIIEENVSLRLKVEEMIEKSENLKNTLDYSNMMHTTLTNLKNEEMKGLEENKNNQLDYARMMNSTLLNLNTVFLSSK